MSLWKIWKNWKLWKKITAVLIGIIILGVIVTTTVFNKLDVAEVRKSTNIQNDSSSTSINERKNQGNYKKIKVEKRVYDINRDADRQLHINIKIGDNFYNMILDTASYNMVIKDYIPSSRAEPLNRKKTIRYGGDETVIEVNYYTDYYYDVPVLPGKITRGSAPNILGLSDNTPIPENVINSNYTPGFLSWFIFDNFTIDLIKDKFTINDDDVSGYNTGNREPNLKDMVVNFYILNGYLKFSDGSQKYYRVIIDTGSPGYSISNSHQEKDAVELELLLTTPISLKLEKKYYTGTRALPGFDNTILIGVPVLLGYKLLFTENYVGFKK